jgi:beta-glucosidase
MLRTKFTLGLFESESDLCSHFTNMFLIAPFIQDPYPYEDWRDFLRTNATRSLLHDMERETIVLLQNNNGVLPISKSGSSVALIGPQVNRVTVRVSRTCGILCETYSIDPQFGDYVFFNASLNGISPLDGAKQVLAGTDVTINFAQGCELWSNDQSGFADAVSAAEKSDVAVVMVGTWCAFESHQSF